MKTQFVQCDKEGKIDVSNVVRVNGIDIALVEENNYLLAKYNFEPDKIRSIEHIRYTTSNYKIVFNITPSVISEHLFSKTL